MVVKYVSTRMGFGSQGWNNWVGPGSPAFAVNATPVVPSSFSLVEVISTNGSTLGGLPGNVRYWSYVAPADGALRIDPMLSMPGPNAHLDSHVALSVFRISWVFQTSTTLDYEQETVPIHSDSSAGGSQYLFYSGQSVGPSGSDGHGSIMVEEGETYIFLLQAIRTGPHREWGISLRVSELRTTASDGDVWYQLPDRTVSSRYDTDSSEFWHNRYPIDSWDKIDGTGPTASNAFAGNWKWHRSFHGLDPVTEIGAYLAVTHAWQHACSESRGVFPTVYANPGWDGLGTGVPEEYPYAPAHYGEIGGGGIDLGGEPTGIGAWNKWSAGSSGLGLFEYASSEMVTYMGAFYLSLHHEAWETGPMVYYTSTECLAFAGVDAREVVGFLYEDVLPDITRVQVVPDWYGSYPAASTWHPAPAQWWVGKTRYLPSMYWDSGADAPDPASVGWGPFVGIGGHPDGILTHAPEWVLGETVTGRWPSGYISSTGMIHLGDYESGMRDEPAGSLTTWEVPEATWRAGWELEEAMNVDNTIYAEYRDPDNPAFEDYAYQFWKPLGLTFMVGTAETLAAYPLSPGVTQPSIEEGDSHAKGLHGLTIWPKITYKPTRFKIVYAPELEIPLLQPTAGPPLLRQHFSPLLGGDE